MARSRLLCSAWAAGLTMMSGPALGQVRPTDQAQAPAPAAALGPTDFLDAATRVTAAVDRYEMGMVWDVSSPIMKASIPKDRFVASTAQRRAALGGIRTREWNAIMRVAIAQAGGTLPPGQYMSVRFATVGQSGSTMDEVISFHLDAGDGQWKLAGYTIQ